MATSLEQFVRDRAGNVCEYCLVPEVYDTFSYQIDHIIAVQHNGQTVLGNLALACTADNKYKGPNIAGRDSATRQLVPLFHPRRHRWNYHFLWDGPVLVGRTAIGRVTVNVLKMNLPYRVELRADLLAAGVRLRTRRPI